MTWTPPEGATEDYYAALPWPESQRKLAEGAAVPHSARLATCGWHGTKIDPNRGAFAIVRSDGPLADLLGERVRVGAYPRAAYVYVTDERADVEEDISLTRRAFAALAPLATDELAVKVEVMDGA